MTDINFTNTEYAGMAVDLKQCPQDGRPEIVLAGRSNVGKSSLVNSLVNRKSIARVSGTPGKTQAVQYFLVDNTFYLTDLPGYGFARASQDKIKKFSRLVDDYLTSDRPIQGVLHLLDIRHAPSEADHLMQEWLWNQDIPFVIVLTKADKCSAAERGRRVAQIKKDLGLDPEVELLVLSNSKRTGVEQTRTAILQLLAED